MTSFNKNKKIIIIIQPRADGMFGSHPVLWLTLDQTKPPLCCVRVRFRSGPRTPQ